MHGSCSGEWREVDVAIKYGLLILITGLNTENINKGISKSSIPCTN